MPAYDDDEHETPPASWFQRTAWDIEADEKEMRLESREDDVFSERANSIRLDAQVDMRTERESADRYREEMAELSNR